MNDETLRILDVNFNRGREALRVIEDYARFVLDDRAAAGAVKACRHEWRALGTCIGAEHLLAARDIVGDVGRDVKTAGELERGSLEDVVRAAFGRLSEATRVLGECGKLVPGDVAAGAERLRYRGYELEQRIALRGTLRARLRAVRLYVLLTERLCRRAWQDVAEAVLRGGAGCLQLREKGLPDGELLKRALELRAITSARRALLAVNDRPDIAKLAGADIVHVGQDDLAVRLVRRIAGAGILVGKSTHTRAQFEAAQVEEPDYLAVGPMFPSATKPQEHLAGVATLAAARQQTDLPLVAIGGITADNVRAVRAAGANCVAACAAVIGAEDPEAAARALCAETGQAP